MKFGSVCSGIGSPELAWKSLGWEAQWVSEIASFPKAVLDHHMPTVPNLGDVNSIHTQEVFNERPIELLVGGTPCQSFSLAGLRGGLDDPRGDLALVFLKIVDRKRPRWVVWENVPGVLSSHGGRDFGTFLAALGQLGYGWAYRVLDAQYCGVPQRRRRVFVIGHLGDWRGPAAVLFERHSLSGHSPPVQEPGQDLAPTIGARPTGGGGLGTDAELDGALIPEIAGTLGSGGKTAGSATSQDAQTGMLVSNHPVLASHNTGDPARQNYVVHQGKTESAHPLMSNYNPQDPTMQDFVVYENHGQDSRVREVSVAPQINARAGTGGNNLPLALGHRGMAVARVRRLTPRECERLQGFPDDYTLIHYRRHLAKDSPRYKAIGNSMAVPVMKWIGKRIAMVDGLVKSSSGQTARSESQTLTGLIPSK